MAELQYTHWSGLSSSLPLAEREAPSGVIPSRMVPLPSVSFLSGSLKRPVNPPGRALFFLSGNKAVAARFGNKNARSGGIRLDFSPEAIDVRFERMGRYAGVIAPNFL